jgi:hypothetical protein
LVLVTNFRETTQSQKQNFPLSDALYIKMCTSAIIISKRSTKFHNLEILHNFLLST